MIVNLYVAVDLAIALFTLVVGFTPLTKLTKLMKAQKPQPVTNVMNSKKTSTWSPR